MTAVFGKLQGSTLECKDGLNILQAPNETGKSTWSAFLISMFYGINSRERDRAGFIADKNRYAPWNGALMSGRLDCTTAGQAITLLRTTRRQAAPMADFQAIYTGTGDPVPGLSGVNCGETLLGVSREVFERSAFIRQSGLSISQDAGLERRIAALITSGDEDTSYTEAVTALKKQLNRRRHNKTGQLPALEAQLQETRRQIRENETLEAQLAAFRRQETELARQETALTAELSALDRWEAAQKAQALTQARIAAEEAAQAVRAMQERIQADRIPENDTIGRLRAAIVQLTTVRRSAEKARGERDEAMKVLLRAEAAVSKSPFAGQPPEEARREAETPLKVSVNAAPALAIFFSLMAIAAASTGFAFSRYGAYLSGWMAALPWSIFAVITIAALLISRQMQAHAAASARAAAAQKRYGTADPAAITALADTYIHAYQHRDDAQADVHAKSATAEALCSALTTNEQAILLEVRRFAPTAFDISNADQLLRECALRRKELAEAQSRSKEAAMRYELLRQQASVSAETSEAITPPQRSRDTVTAQLSAIQADAAAVRSACDRLSGQLSAAESSAVLRSFEARLTEQIQALETEYDAIQLAMDTLEQANTTLQTRFSPVLGRRTAEIFSALTENRYSGVVLDRSLHLSAEPNGSTVYRDAALLSAGAADQLYLAARLAICDLVLPQETSAPLILDDALANFDDKRCAAALRWLKEESRHRQILLFTCHSREAEFFAGDPEVSIQQLTDAV